MTDVTHQRQCRLLVVLSGLGVGGNESQAISLLGAIDRGRFSPIVVSISNETGLAEAALKKINVPVVRVPISKFGMASFVWRIARVVRRWKIDTVLNAGFSKQHLYVHAGALLGGASKRISRVSAAPPDPRLKWKLKFIQIASRFVCTHEVAVSYWVSQWLTGFGGYPSDRVHVIPNGCDVSSIRARVTAVRREGRKPASRVIMVARLEAAKDHDTLLRAMGEVRLRLPDAELLVVGDGPRRKELEALALQLNAGARFLGSRGDVPELLGTSDVFVFSTHTEGFGLALIEAMAADLPVVASNIPACREVLDGGRAGLLFPVGDSALLAQHLVLLLEDGDARAFWVAAARERVTVYDLLPMVRSYEILVETAN